MKPFPLRRAAEDAASTLPGLMIRAERAAYSVFHGEHAQRKIGPGEKFWQFREYAPQDRPQDIDWRQSGKTDRLFIRQKERQLPQTALFWACAAKSMDYSSSSQIPAKRVSAKILVLALAIMMTRAGERVGMLESAQVGRSDAALENIGEIMISGKNSESLPHAAPARAHKNASVLLAGDFLSPPGPVDHAFKNLAARAGGGFVIQILDPAEIELPWNGRAIFEEPGTQRREIAQNVTSIREAYKKRIRDHIAAIEKVSRDCGWHYILHRTDRPYEETLMKIWLEFSALKARGAA